MADGLRKVDTIEDLARVLRQLRRREARERHRPELTYRKIAAKTGCSVGVIGDYFSGKVLPPTDRFDALIQLLGAAPAEQGELATARDRVAERRKHRKPAAGQAMVPHQLPAGVPGFAGRHRQLAALDALLAERDQAVMTVVISGTAGVGKTALAVHWAHQVAQRFADGQLFVNLRGFDPTGPALRPAEAVRGFLDALGVPAAQVPADFAAQTALYRTLVADRQMLIILDNARDAEQIRPLLPGSAGCFVLVTSRGRLTGLLAGEGACPLSLDVLAEPEARELLRRRLADPARLAAEPDAVDEIIACCARLPLALTVIAARATTHPEFPLRTLAAELRDARRGLDAFDTNGDATTDVRSVFSWSYRLLGDAAAGLFRLLSLHPGPDTATTAAASLAATPVAQARRLLAELSAAHLIGEPVPGRFAMHDLLRAYAAELTQAHDPPARRREAVRRLLDHYLRGAHAADQLLSPQWTPIAPLPAADGVVPDVVDTDTAAIAWFSAERAVLLDAVPYAAAEGFDVHAWQLAWTLTDFLDRRGDWHDWADTQQFALAAATRLRDPTAQAHVHRGLAGAFARLGRYDDGQSHLRQALVLFDRLGDVVNRARTLLNAGWVYDQQGRPAEALRYAVQALELLRAAGHRDGEAGALNGIGWLHAELGQHDLARASCEQALKLYRASGDRHGEAGACDSIGYAHHHLGNYAEAVACFERAVRLRRETGSRYYEADALLHLGDTREAMGDRVGARDARHQALAILDDIGHPSAEELRARLEGAHP